MRIASIYNVVFNRKKLRAKRYMKLAACVAIIATVFSVSPMRSLADYIVKKLKITINFNENNVNIGDAYETKITIPKDCKEVQYDNVMYLTKAYNSIDTLESFLIMIYQRMEKKMEYQVCLNMCIFL